MRQPIMKTLIGVPLSAQEPFPPELVDLGLATGVSPGRIPHLANPL